MDGKEKRMQNLRKFSTLSPEERTEISTKGGKARAQQRREQKNLRETALTLLNTKISRDQAQKLIGDDSELIEDTDLTMQAILTVRAMRAVLDDGNIKGAEFLRDTSGQRPKDEIQIDGNVIMTDSDRRLLENIKKRLQE